MAASVSFFRSNTLLLSMSKRSKNPFPHHKIYYKTNITTNANNPVVAAAAAFGNHQSSVLQNQRSKAQILVLPKEEKQNVFSEFDFNDYLMSKIKKVNEALDQALPTNHQTQIHEAMRYSLLLPGKRIRPVLCLASCELMGGNDTLAMPIACAIEMIQTMSLMLDDLPCMDDDDLRRGKPANHKVFGEESAILASSSLLTLAFQYIAEKTTDVPAEKVVRAIIEIASATGFDGLLGGELLDLHSEGKEVSLDELKYIHIQKTAKLIEASAVCGAIMGGGNEREIEKLRKYGKHVGLMYQVVDDIVGLTKTSEELGKTPGKDLDCDKAIYPKLMGVEGAKKCVDELMGNAMEELSYFDSTTASPLFYLANYIVKRLS